MPDNRNLIITSSLLFVLTHASAFHIEGKTHQGMPFRGELQSSNGGYIQIIQSEDLQQVGIPIGHIREVSPTVDATTGSDILKLFKHPAILHLWNSEVHDRMIDCLESMALDGEWTNCYHGVTRLEQALTNKQFKQRIHLIKAWSLFELGLQRKCYAVLDHMDTYQDPTLAVPRYCWLRAREALSQNDLETATYWSILPAVRIPCDTSNLSMQMYNECNSWRENE